MRKTLSAFLMLVMVAATMMCFCVPEAQAGVSKAHTHAGHHYNQGHHQGKSDTPDCKGTDMQIPQQASVSAPDLKSNLHLDFAFASDASVWKPVLISDNAIRGPPPDWPGLSKTQPSILLTTQRLRI